MTAGDGLTGVPRLARGHRRQRAERNFPALVGELGQSTEIFGLIAYLGLPADCFVNRKIPKKMLIEKGAPTPSDRRYITDGIEELIWIAALKPKTVGVAEYRDNVREYLEIAVLRLSLRPQSKLDRLSELVHRAVPYPVLLLTDSHGGSALLSAHKRWAQNEANKAVLDDGMVSVPLGTPETNPLEPVFKDALDLTHQPKSNLLDLYQGSWDAILAFQISSLTGKFAIASSPGPSAMRRKAYNDCLRLDGDIARLRSAVKREKQVPRQVALNLEIKKLELARKAEMDKL